MPALSTQWRRSGLACSSCGSHPGPLAGRLSERIDPRILASAGMGVITVGLFVLTTLADTTRLSLLLTLLALLGFGFALFSSPNTNAVMGAVEPRVYGIASGILGTMRLLGQMLSMAVVLLLFSLTMGDYITPSLIGGSPGTELIGGIVADQFGVANNWPLGAALILPVLAIISVFLLIANRFGPLVRNGSRSAELPR